MARGAGRGQRPINSVILMAISAALTAGCGDEAGDTGTSAGAAGAGGAGGAPLSCDTSRAEEIEAVEIVSKGEVIVLSEMDGVKTLYIDASAGGPAAIDENPWIYVNLGAASRVDVNDVEADASDAWDLALERPVIRTNSGDGGPGKGGAAFLKEKAFDDVTDAAAAAASIVPEQWFDAMCVAKKDPGKYLATTFDGWYDYGGEQTHLVTPHPGTFIIRSGKGDALYKLELKSYYANPDGTEGMAGGRFLVRVAPVAK